MVSYSIVEGGGGGLTVLLTKYNSFGMLQNLQIQCIPLLHVSASLPSFYNHAGKPLMDDSGELVCTKPFPSMPTNFWNDDDGIKYTKAYFTKFQGKL